MGNFETNPKKLKDDLLTSISTREMALPDFQRSFVWQPGQTKALIVSLARGFPAGSILRMENGGDVFIPRAFESAPPLKHSVPRYLVLDGQQRLTSLYQALYGTGEHLFYVNLNKLLGKGDDATKEDLDAAVFFEKHADGDKPWDRRRQAVERVLPLSELFGGKGFHKWLGDMETLLASDKQGAIVQNDRLHLIEVYTSYVEPIEDYEFPVVTLTKKTSLEAVCSIFETLNNTGVKLSVFDLLSARFFAKKKNLRQLWDDAVENSDFFREFELDPYYILQAISSQVKNSIKRSDVLALHANDVANKWDDAVWGMEQTLGLLHDECGVLSLRWLSYNTVLVPMASVFMANRKLKGPSVGALRSKLKRWYWCSILGQTYESNPTSQSLTDIGELQAWLDGGDEPSSVKDFAFKRQSLFKTTTRQRAVYRGVMCLLLREPPLDFYSTKPITAGLLRDRHIDDHHVFPRAHVKLSQFKRKKMVDSILNRTLIDSQTNRIIGRNSPKVYLRAIEARLKAKKLKEVLRSHMLLGPKQSTPATKTFDKFLDERADAIYGLILEATQ